MRQIKRLCIPEKINGGRAPPNYIARDAAPRGDLKKSGGIRRLQKTSLLANNTEKERVTEVRGKKPLRARKAFGLVKLQ